MSEQTTEQQLFLGEVEKLVEIIRNSLCVPNPILSQLVDSAQAVTTFKAVATDPTVESFRLIVDQLEVVFGRHLTDQTLPDRLELELVELAIDWLTQLAILYGENLPEPKSLVSELIYTFQLVESSQGAVTLAELVSSRAEKGSVDPFSDDPEFSVKRQAVSSHRDPFAEDPGFGLEFDLLHRTINVLAAKQFMEEAPTGDNDSEDSPSSDSSDLDYDFFADDPPLTK